MSDLPTPIEVFYSYAHEDESLRAELEKHLSLLRRRGLIAAWYDRQIVPGTDWAKTIDTHLETASVILLLVSADFVASDYCYGIEMQRALERHQAKQACVIPILLRPVDWYGAPFAHLQALPTNAKAVTSWGDQDAAFSNVAEGIRRAIEDLSHLSNTPPADLHERHESLQHQSSPSPQSVSGSRESHRKTTLGLWRDPIWQAIGVIVAVIGIMIPIIASHIFPSSTPFTPSTPSSGNPFPSYLAGHGHLVMSDPLVNNSLGYLWHEVTFPNDPGSCQFAADGYYVQADNNYYPCQDGKVVPTNFAFEVKMRHLADSAGGLSFRNTVGGAGYDVDVSPSGYFSINRPNNIYLVQPTLSPLISMGHPSYLVDIEALGNRITLYVDKIKIISVADNTPSCSDASICGYIGLYVTGDSSTPQTEVTFTNLRVWSLV